MPFRRDAARLKRGFQCAVRWGGLERQFDLAPGAENDRGAHGHIQARIEPNPVDLRQRDFRIPFAGEPRQAVLVERQAAGWIAEDLP